MFTYNQNNGGKKMVAALAYRAREAPDKLHKDIGVKGFSSVRYTQRVSGVDRFMMPPEKRMT